MTGGAAAGAERGGGTRRLAPAPGAEPRGLEVIAPLRLHFGLLSWGGAGRQFGGVGLMLETPCVRVRAVRAERLAATGPHADRVLEFARRWEAARAAEGTNELAASDVAFQVVEAPPQHVGLGLGTQLGLAVGLALERLVAGRDPTPVELAVRMGRGLRSSVGAYGFFAGGLIYEPGKLAHERVAPAARHLAPPADWRVVLVRPRASAGGEAGETERKAFASLPPVPEERTARLVELVERELWPAVERGDCATFGQALYEYGRLAGECFAPWQGGPFNGPVLAALVDRLRSFGCAGVGQSSWGPTLFAIAESPDEAERLARRLREEPDGATLEVSVGRPAARGARVVEFAGV